MYLVHTIKTKMIMLPETINPNYHVFTNISCTNYHDIQLLTDLSYMYLDSITTLEGKLICCFITYDGKIKKKIILPKGCLHDIGNEGMLYYNPEHFYFIMRLHEEYIMKTCLFPLVNYELCAYHFDFCPQLR